MTGHPIGESSMFSQAMTNVFRDLSMMARLTRDLPRFLRAPMSVEEAETALRHRLETRVERFLAMVEHHISAIHKAPTSSSCGRPDVSLAT